MQTLLTGLGACWETLAAVPLQWQLGRWRQLVPPIAGLERPLAALDDGQLRKASLALRYRAKSGEPLDDLLPEAFALVRAAASRRLGMRHYDVQLIGGIAMHHRAIAEMQTGEGKTLTATLPTYLAALPGKGTHVATANDYLARRDAELMTPLYEALGFSVGVVESATSRGERRRAYLCDVTYGTAKEFGFDFLRDRLHARRRVETESDVLGNMLDAASGDDGEGPLQREPFFALVDEADSILIDEARTPLVISAMPGDSHETAVALCRWAASVADRFREETHYRYDHDRRQVELNALGRRLVRELTHPEELTHVGMYDLYEHAERAVKVARDFVRDRQYIVREGEIVIVDEFTGRLAEGRKWRSGIHQALEAREGLAVTVDSGQAARITVQDYFLRYERLAGMTGTAAAARGEMRAIYGLRVAAIPTNRPAIRRRLPDRVFGTADAKWRAIVEEIAQMHALGRPVLVGTRSIDKSQLLSLLLTEAALPHAVLNARNVAAEADIIAAAGAAGKITVATNMAGRGTDIRLGPGVEELGGLHVICSEMHDSARVDRQLIGRCGRQGDPGSFRQFLALDDELLEAGLGPKVAERYRRMGRQSQGPFDRLAHLFAAAQATIESRHFQQRKLLMYHEKERREAQLRMGLDPYLDSPA